MRRNLLVFALLGIAGASCRPMPSEAACTGVPTPATFHFDWSNGNPGILMYNRWTEPPSKPCLSFRDSLAKYDPFVILKP